MTRGGYPPLLTSIQSQGERSVKKFSKTLFGTLMAASLLAGCHNDDDSNGPTAPAEQIAFVRYVHASPDAPAVNIRNGATTIASKLDYKQVTPVFRNTAGTLGVSVDAIVPGGTATVIGPANVTLAADTSYTVLAVGQVGTATLAPLVVPQASAGLAPGYVRAKVVHAAPNAPAVDVYVTAPTAALATTQKLGSFAFGQVLGPATLPFGTYRIRVTLANQPGTVVFDSGSVSLNASEDLLLTAVQNTGPGAAPVSLLLTSPSRATAAEVSDVGTPAQVRVIHASPDAPAVDVIANNDCAHPLLTNVPFPAFSSYLSVPPATYSIKVTAAGNCGAIVIDANLTLAAGKEYSVFATGKLASIAPYVLTDDRRPLATAAKVRIVHTAPSAGNVDIYVTVPGASIAAATPAFANVPFRAETGYVNLAGGTYAVTVTPTGTKTAAIGPATITVTDGRVYTAAARDAVGGGGPFGLILLDDFNP
jgi:hypothetical protein